MPFGKAWVGAADQLPPETIAVRASTGEPAVPRPEKILTMTAEESPGAVPASPENGGFVSLVVLPLPGLVSVTAGGSVLMVYVAWAGVGSTLPAGLTARTSKRCRPSLSAA